MRLGEPREMVARRYGMHRLQSWLVLVFDFRRGVASVAMKLADEDEQNLRRANRKLFWRVPREGETEDGKRAHTPLESTTRQSSIDFHLQLLFTTLDRRP